MLESFLILNGVIMKNNCLAIAILCLIIGGAIGAGITYYQVRCKTTGMSIQLESSGSGPGITVTKTGDDKQ
jgi:hypothetical protein